ncbi:hypothetical protein QE152_g41159 [Popillia japonica]|uniref:Uncharacterized protein n=1 Tax=Popillia japonica TaxID=7064 RepID=A0AAW1H5V6_POPJA
MWIRANALYSYNHEYSTVEEWASFPADETVTAMSINTSSAVKGLLVNTYNESLNQWKLYIYTYPTANVEFGFVVFNQKPGFYQVGLVPQRLVYNYTFYLKPNDSFSAAFKLNEFTLTGSKNSLENKEMARWREFGFVVFNQKPGFYQVGLVPQRLVYNYTFYLKPNDSFSAAFKLNEFTRVWFCGV